MESKNSKNQPVEKSREKTPEEILETAEKFANALVSAINRLELLIKGANMDNPYYIKYIYKALMPFREGGNMLRLLRILEDRLKNVCLGLIGKRIQEIKEGWSYEENEQKIDIRNDKQRKFYEQILSSVKLLESLSKDLLFYVKEIKDYIQKDNMGIESMNNILKLLNTNGEYGFLMLRLNHKINQGVIDTYGIHPETALEFEKKFSIQPLKKIPNRLNDKFSKAKGLSDILSEIYNEASLLTEDRPPFLNAKGEPCSFTVPLTPEPPPHLRPGNKNPLSSKEEQEIDDDEL